LVRASLTAYAIPLVVALTAGAVAQWLAGNDVVTLLTTLAGLVLGLGLSRLGADCLLTRGELVPKFLRRARFGETCGASGHERFEA
jgi:sigma-E factor negative regulatory protein RseC